MPTSQRRPRARWTEWFPIFNTTLNSDTSIGPIDHIWLHPQALQTTPYAAQLANCTHRREYLWQFECYVTTASFTGCRMAVVALPDPGYDNAIISPELIWGAVMNRRGVMVESTGNHSRRSRFRIQTATTALSNATPPDLQNMMGYSAAVLILYCLQPPIAVNNQVLLAVTLLGRCYLACENPVPGFSLFQLPIHHNDVDIPSGAQVAWSFAATHSQTSNGNSSIDSGWLQSHNGGAWLAGGIYFKFYNWGSSAPNQTGTQSPWASVYGTPKRMAVYTTDQEFPQWEDNDRTRKRPKYFVTFVNPIHHYPYLVGFQLLEHAMMQAQGNTAMVPHGAELCIRYSGTIKWKEAFPLTSENDIKVKFYEIWSSNKSYPWGGPIYTTTNTCTSLSAYTTTATYTTATPRTEQVFPQNTLVGIPELLTSQHQLAPSCTTYNMTVTSSSVTPSRSNSTPVTSWPKFETSLNPAEQIQQLEQQLQELRVQLLQPDKMQDLQTCQCPGACNCPQSQLHSSVEQDVLEDPLQISPDTSDTETETDWDDTTTDSTTTLVQQSHINWLTQQQTQLANLEQIAMDHDYAQALQRTPSLEPTAPASLTPPLSPHSLPNWARLLNYLRSRSH